MRKFPFYKQLNAMDCGPTCLRMVAKFYGKHYSIDTLRQMAGFSRTGVSMLAISETAENIGFRTRGVKVSEQQLRNLKLPLILHWNQNHFVVLIVLNNKSATIADPGRGILKYDKAKFLKHWLASKNEEGEDVGSALEIDPTPEFYSYEGQKEHKLNLGLVSRYLYSSTWQVAQIFLAFIVVSILTLIFPFLTQSIVDIGINIQNLQYVVVILLAQAMLIFSQTFVEFIRGRILLRVSNIINIQILSDFWIKLTRLPVSYFDAHHVGDTLQRIGDHGKIQGFLLGTALTTLFSLVNFVVYSIVLMIYSPILFFVFCGGAILYFCWIALFLRMRRKLNVETFHLSAKENDATLQLIQGMQEIRLNNAERQKRWEWENIKASIYNLGFKNLNYNQIQTAGATFINRIQGIFISFIVAKMVIDGKLTLGAMLAIQYVVGQLSSPIQQWVGFIQSLQDAKISLERLNEIHQLEDEEKSDNSYIHQLPENKAIFISNLSFTYPGAGNEPVLSDIDLVIPANKVTAIVGTSGSGKTTLIKLLLKVYLNYKGEIRIGKSDHLALGINENDGTSFNVISPAYWRGVCGAVLQDGFIFNDSIARNIAVGYEQIDHNRLIHSCKVANVQSFIESLPNGYHTKMGAEGISVSQGQRQRILIARAAYKDPTYLFFDEATNALDANNEKEIVENLRRVYKGKTVIVVAHRLSTVKHADKIVVLHKGRIVEEGTHDELTKLKGKYFELVKNQLELGN